MRITAKVHTITPKVEGQSDNGYWCKRQLVVETTDTHPKKVAVTFNGENRIAWLNDLKPGMLVEVNFDVASREYEGRYYTELTGYGVKAYTPMTSDDAPPEAGV